MIVDTARDRRIYGMLLSHFYSQHTCLFSGNLSPALKLAAPYLIQLEHDDRKTRQFISHAWANSWGIFAEVRYADEVAKTPPWPATYRARCQRQSADVPILRSSRFEGLSADVHVR